jgi:hypothetical protein
MHEFIMTQKHSGRMRRLVAADLVPERAGQPVKAWVHISLADLLLLDGDSALQEQWTLCRRRHKVHYADIGIMPTWRERGLAGAGNVTLMSA